MKIYNSVKEVCYNTYFLHFYYICKLYQNWLSFRKASAHKNGSEISPNSSNLL